MAHAGQRVESLTKVTLSVTAEPEPGSRRFTASSVRFSFIYGIGPAGLTPFESLLAGLSAGDTVRVKVEAGTQGEAFGHLRSFMPEIKEGIRAVHYMCRVEELAPARPREVIRALAETASCGDQCCGH